MDPKLECSAQQRCNTTRSGAGGTGPALMSEGKERSLMNSHNTHPPIIKDKNAWKKLIIQINVSNIKTVQEKEKE